jgi:hypothetical protein
MYCRNTLTEAFPQGPPGPIDVYRTIKKVWLQLAQPAYSIFNFLLCDGITMFAVSDFVQFRNLHFYAPVLLLQWFVYVVLAVSIAPVVLQNSTL